MRPATKTDFRNRGTRREIDIGSVRRLEIMAAPQPALPNELYCLLGDDGIRHLVDEHWRGPLLGARRVGDAAKFRAARVRIAAK